MTALLIGIIFFAILIIVCFKNFFIQMIAIKLLLDALVLILVASRNFSQNPFNTQATAVVVAGIGLPIFFMLMSSAIQMFSKNEKVGLKVGHE